MQNLKTEDIVEFSLFWRAHICDAHRSRPLIRKVNAVVRACVLGDVKQLYFVNSKFLRPGAEVINYFMLNSTEHDMHHAPHVKMPTMHFSINEYDKYNICEFKAR